jgi:hypothetical protein
MKSYRWVTLIAALLITAVPVGAIAAASPAACDLRLSVELTPDIPDPLDAGFLSSLLSNEVNYQLTLLGSRRGSVVLSTAVKAWSKRCAGTVVCSPSTSTRNPRRRAQLSISGRPTCGALAFGLCSRPAHPQTLTRRTLLPSRPRRCWR